MKSKIHIGFFAVTAALVVFGSGVWLYTHAGALRRPDVQSIGKLKDAERIARSSEHLRHLADKPQETNIVLVSFDRLQDKEFVRDLVVKNNLPVKWVYFTIPTNEGPTTRGGFVPGDDMEAAFKNHEANLLASFEVSIESMRRATADEPQFVVETEKDREFIKDYEMAKVALREYKERLAKVKQDGAMYNGVQVEVRNDKALELARTPGIRVVEIVSEKVNQKVSPILPEGIESFTRRSIPGS